MKRIMYTLLLAAAFSLPVASASASEGRYLNQTQIQAVQQSLREAGYYQKAPVDGLWGHYSRNAMKSYQIDKGLKATGIPDKETVARLGVRIPDAKQAISGRRM